MLAARRPVAALVALAAFAAFWSLGVWVTHHAEPAPFVALEAALLNHSTLIAWWVTWLCYVYALVPIAVVLAILAWRLPAWRWPILLSLAALLLSWQGADLAQHFFARPRRLDWVVRRETAFSYPSSHAAIAAGFYGAWAVMLGSFAASKRARVLGAAVLSALVVAICWSRLALGAHYLTDLAGGFLWGTAVAAALFAAVPEKVFAPLRGARKL